MEMLESGQLEKMVLEFLQSPQTEQMVDELMAEVMRPPTEDEMAQMQQVWTEMMSSMMSEEELAQMQQRGMAELLGTMELKMHCKCAMVGSVTNPSERGFNFKHGG